MWTCGHKTIIQGFNKTIIQNNYSRIQQRPQTTKPLAGLLSAHNHTYQEITMIPPYLNYLLSGWALMSLGSGASKTGGDINGRLVDELCTHNDLLCLPHPNNWASWNLFSPWPFRSHLTEEVLAPDVDSWKGSYSQTPNQDVSNRISQSPPD